MVERQEIYCHACTKYVQFNLDTALDGNHVLHCPNCGHEHCRVVRGGRITGDRWDTRNGPTFTITASTASTNSLYTTYTTSDCTTGGSFLFDSWLQTTSGA
jgi:hypothetical protein